MNKTQFTLKALAGLVIGASMQFAVASTFSDDGIATTLGPKGTSNCSVSCDAGQTATCSATATTCECSCTDNS